MQVSNGCTVSAITVFGDPSFTHGQSFDVGTDTTEDGVSSHLASIFLLYTGFIDNWTRFSLAMKAVTALHFSTHMLGNYGVIATPEMSIARLVMIPQLIVRKFLLGETQRWTL
jgi:hypothetical protein